MGPGKKRDWGYASSDEDGNPTYTSYEKDGSVNRYSDRGDGYHTHEHWKDKDDYNSGKDPDQSRYDKGKSENPSIGEVQKNGGCYLTTACMEHFKTLFEDDCYELRVLRWFRDEYVDKADINHYYKTAPIVVEAINSLPEHNKIYDYIYDNVVYTCVKNIEEGQYNKAYDTYMSNMLTFEEQFAKPLLQSKVVKTLKLIKTR